MKKIVYVLVAILAFTLSLFVFYIHPIFIPISLDKLRENNSQYKSLKIKVIGNFEVLKAEATYFFALQDYKNNCSGDAFCYKGLELSDKVLKENILLINELAEKNQALGKIDSRQGVYLAEIEVAGYLEERNLSMFGNSVDYIIKVEQINQISPIRFVTSEELKSSK